MQIINKEDIKSPVEELITGASKSSANLSESNQSATVNVVNDNDVQSYKLQIRTDFDKLWHENHDNHENHSLNECLCIKHTYTFAQQNPSSIEFNLPVHSKIMQFSSCYAYLIDVFVQEYQHVYVIWAEQCASRLEH